MEWPEPDARGAGRPRVPLAAKVLVGCALLLAAERAVDVATGRLFDVFSPPEWYRELAPEAMLPYLGYVAMVLAAIVAVALRQRWGIVLFAVSWGANYLISLGVHLPQVLWGDSAWQQMPGIRWELVCHLVVVNGLLAAFAIACVASAAVRHAVLRSGPAQPQWEPQPLPPARLPLPAKLLAVEKAVANGMAIFSWVQLLAMFPGQYGSAGMRSPLSFLSLLDQVPYARPAAHILVALAGLVGAVMLLLRRHWGRWLLIGAGCIQVLPSLGYWLSISQFARGYGIEKLLPARIHWDMVIGIAVVIANLAFEVAYLCDRTVREAMVSDAEE